MKIASEIASPLLSFKKNIGTDVFCNIGTPFNFLSLPTGVFPLVSLDSYQEFAVPSKSYFQKNSQRQCLCSTNGKVKSEALFEFTTAVITYLLLAFSAESINYCS